MPAVVALRDADSLPYVPLVPYNGTIPTGGNSLTQNLNVFYQSGDIAWYVAGCPELQTDHDFVSRLLTHARTG